jgi:DNA-binding NarL/FixJ family response regulator
MKSFLLIDDHAVVRRGVSFLLNDLYNPCVIDEAEDEQQVLEKISSRNYDLLVLDINIPNTNTLDLLKQIFVKTPEAKVLMFSMNQEKMYAQRYLDAGAKGFLSKDAPIVEIERAINLIFNGKNYYSEALIDSIMSGKKGTTKANPFKNLSEREFEICNLLLAGKSLTEISQQLNIQTSTTGTHKAKIFEKLDVKNLVELIELSKVHM